MLQQKLFETQRLSQEKEEKSAALENVVEEMRHSICEQEAKYLDNFKIKSKDVVQEPKETIAKRTISLVEHSWCTDMLNQLKGERLSLLEIAHQSEFFVSELEQRLSDAGEGYENMMKFMKEVQEEVEMNLAEAKTQFEREVFEKCSLKGKAM